MIVDNTLVYSDSQAITATAASTNIVDVGAAGTAFGAAAALARDIGKATEIPLYVSVTQAFNNLTSLKVSFQSDDDPAFGTANNTVAERTYAASELTLGARLPFPAEIPEGTSGRYTRLNYTVTGTAPTTGKIFAGVVAARQTNP
jgi:hypothetical protein